MEVVVLGITDNEEADDGVDNGWTNISICFSGFPDCGRFRVEGMLDNIRFAVGFLPKCLAWYLPRRPVALTSGAGPRGSFS